MRLPRCSRCGITRAPHACLVCEPPPIERWLLGRTLAPDGPFSSCEALGVDTEGRVVARGVVDALGIGREPRPFLDRSRHLQGLEHEALGRIDVVGEEDGLSYRICRTPDEPTARSLTAGGAMSEDLLRGVAVSLLQALMVLHGDGLVHGRITRDTVHVYVDEARAVLVRPAPLAGGCDAASDLSAVGWVLGSLLDERPVAAWRRAEGVKRLVVILLDPSMPTSARAALNRLQWPRSAHKRRRRRLPDGLVG